MKHFVFKKSKVDLFRNSEVAFFSIAAWMKFLLKVCFCRLGGRKDVAKHIHGTNLKYCASI